MHIVQNTLWNEDLCTLYIVKCPKTKKKQKETKKTVPNLRFAVALGYFPVVRHVPVPKRWLKSTPVPLSTIYTGPFVRLMIS